MNICSAVSLWAEEISNTVDPYNENDKSFCRAVRAFIGRIKDMVDRSPFLLRANREDAHQMGIRSIETTQGGVSIWHPLFRQNQGQDRVEILQKIDALLSTNGRELQH